MLSTLYNKKTEHIGILASMFLTISLSLVFYKVGMLGGAIVILTVIFFFIILSLKILHLEWFFPTILFLSALLPLQKEIGFISFYSIDLPLILIYILYFFDHSISTVKKLGRNHLYIILIILLFWLFISSIAGRAPATSFNGSLLFMRFFLIYYYFANINTKGRHINLLLVVIVLSVMMEGTIGVVQYALKSHVGSLSDQLGESQDIIREVGSFGNLFRVKGTFSYDTSLGLFLEIYIPLVLSFLFVKRYRKYRFTLIMGVILGLLALLFTFARGAWGGTIIGFCVVLYYIVKKGYIRFTKAALVVLIALMVMIPLSMPLAPLIHDRLFGANSEDSLESRAVAYYIALQTTLKHPLFGIGLDNLGIEAATSYGLRLGYDKNIKAHNIFLLLSSETGIIGMIIFSIWLFYILKTGRNNIISPHSENYTIISIGLMGGIVASLIHNMAAWNIFSAGASFHFWVIAGIINAIDLSPKS